MDQNWTYWADSSRVERRASFCTDSTKSDCGDSGPGEEDREDGEEEEEAGKGCEYAGRSARQREKAGEGKTVSALARILVTVSGWRR